MILRPPSKHVRPPPPTGRPIIFRPVPKPPPKPTNPAFALAAVAAVKNLAAESVLPEGAVVPRIAVLTGIADEYYAPLALHTICENKAEYCRRHGYHLEVIYGVREKFRDGRTHAGGFSWSRLEHLAEMVEAAKHEWVWTVGADTLITNLTLPLEEIIAMAETPAAETAPFPKCPPFPNSPAPPKVIEWKAPPKHRWTGRKHLLICGERVTSMQADSFLVRCSPEGSAWVRDMLAHYELYKHHSWVENQTMIDLRDKWAAITFMVPQWRLNSVDYSRWYWLRPQYRDGTDCYGNRGQWRKGDFMIHWPAASMPERFRFLAQYQPQIVR